jgi:hypothetical protein
MTVNQPNRPRSIDPEQWAMWNYRTARALVSAMGPCAPTPEDEVDIDDVAIEVIELPPSFADLERAINRAASELQEQGEKSNRIAIQLLTALARFHSELGK